MYIFYYKVYEDFKFREICEKILKRKYFNTKIYKIGKLAKISEENTKTYTLYNKKMNC